MQGNINRFASNHDVILSYRKSESPFFETQREERDKPKQQQKRAWDPEIKSLKQAKDEQGNLIYYEDTHRTVDAFVQPSLVRAPRLSTFHAPPSGVQPPCHIRNELTPSHTEGIQMTGYFGRRLRGICTVENTSKMPAGGHRLRRRLNA